MILATEPGKEVRQMAGKKISPKKPAAQAKKSTTRTAATRVTKRKSRRKSR
jgi:hypothetical protein